MTLMNTKELKKSLQSLSCGKYRVLIKSTEGKIVNESDSFTFNKGFESSSRILKINSVQAKESLEERKTTREKVFKDRQYQVNNLYNNNYILILIFFYLFNIHDH